MAKNNSRFKADEEEHNWNTKSLKFFVLRSKSIGQSCQKDHTERAKSQEIKACTRLSGSSSQTGQVQEV